MPLITPRIDALFASKVTALITDLSKKYLVEAEITTSTICPNCKYDPVGKAGTGTYNGTGPQPFVKVCPVCRNKGKTEVVTKQQITATAQIGQGIKGDNPLAVGEMPEGHAKIKGLETDIALLRAATAFYIDGVRYDRLGQLKERGLLTKVVVPITLIRSD